MNNKNNVKIIREKKGLTQQNLADLANVSLRHIQNIESGARGLTTVKIITALTQALNCSHADLTGTYQNITTLPSNESYSIKNSATREVPMFNQEFSCGPGAIPLDYLDTTILNIDVKLLKDLTTYTNSVVIIKASGDSMYPIINNNDLVLVDTSVKNLKTSNKSHNLYAFRYDERLCIKKLTFKDKSKNIIIAESLHDKNTNPTFEIILKNNTDFTIIGKVIGNVKKFN